MPRFAIGLSLLCLALLSPSAEAAVVGYQYTGSISFVFPVPPPPFGVTVPSNATVSGTFWYDTDAIGTPSSAQTTVYPQPHWLTVKFSTPGFADLNAASCGYQMQVSNDLAQPAGGPKDIVSFVYSSNLGLDAHWFVNDVPQTSGLLQLNFSANAAARADTSIPADLSFAPLPQPNQLFADTPVGVVDVIFMITSLTSLPASAEPPRPCPEPSTWVLLGLGAAMVLALRRKRSEPAARF